MRILIQALIICTVAFMLLPVGQAAAEGNASFGIRPAYPAGDDPATQAYFIYSLEPGESKNDAAIVTNSGETSLSLKIYSADALTSRTGGIVFPVGEDSAKMEAGSWLSVSVSRLSLEPGESKIVEFGIAVPQDTEVGEHVAGLVAENMDVIEGEGQFAVNTVQRMAVSVFITVPGPVVTGLEIASVEQVWASPAIAFDVALRNTGNVHLNPEGKLEVMDASGAVIGSFPIKLGTFLAGDSIVYRINSNSLLPVGEYSIAVSIDYGASGSTIATAPFEVTKEELKKAIAQAKKEGFDVGPVIITEQRMVWQYVAIAVASVIVIGFLVIRLRRWGIRRA